ncbi:MAG: hypothetical protein BWY15_02409 [Firmicutes bacterium ADurb.Bin193]|nr:MAG: hypothetical protein BWY15_02409 [Firmicutes bacterium ADurb.Bin193]
MKTTIVAVVLVCLVFGAAIAYDDTRVKIQEMVNDLGPPQERAKNNGKVQNCMDGGTKKITIKKSKGGGTSYEGVYKNCREFSSQREGNVVITLGR